MRSARLRHVGTCPEDLDYRLELEGASMRKTIAKMNDEMPQT